MSLPNTEFPAAEIIVDPNPSSGAFNMAMDAALLALGAHRKTTVVRIYEWSEPTVTLGYFQGATTTVSPFPDLPCVKRLSGGGAILHDRELTYSFAAPSSHPVRQSPSDFYERVHRRVIELLGRCGLSCSLRSERPAANAMILATTPTGSVQEPFLCFLRSNPNDIVDTSGIKVVGSAQRRRRGVTLQHGSILLSASAITPSIPGIAELAASFDESLFRAELPEAIAGSLACDWQFRTYTSEEHALCRQMLESDSLQEIP